VKTVIICLMLSDYPLHFPTKHFLIFLAILAGALVSCNRSVEPIITQTATRPADPTPTATPFQASPTPIPAAALVNGEPITLTDFQVELAGYQAAVGTQLATEDQQRVLDNLVDEILLAQASASEGFTADEAIVQQRYDRLVERLGSTQALLDWMAANGYTEAGFRSSLARSISAAWMRDRVAASVPEQIEQVHARQILLYNSEEAANLLAQISSGEDFNTLAIQYDPVGGGDLGWFPRGYLLDPKLDEAAFNLQPEQISQVVQTAAGYHILQVLEREAQRTLDPAIRLVLQQRSLLDWLQNRRSQSQIQVLLP
jgi:parvulin-like peptidyl-prolyl isomerase